MSDIRNGGPAFPVNGNGQPEMTGFGMTLRDAKALAVAGHIWVQFQRDGTARQHSNWREGVAYEAYKLADEMLEFREVESEHNDRS